MGMIKKYHNHKLQTNPWHRKLEPHNNHKTPGRQTKQSNQLSLLHQDDCKTRMDTKQCTTKQSTITESQNGSNKQQRINNNRTTALERTAAETTGGLYAFYWYQTFTLDSAVVDTQKMLSLHGSAWKHPNYYNVSSWRNNLIKLTYYVFVKKVHGVKSLINRTYFVGTCWHMMQFLRVPAKYDTLKRRETIMKLTLIKYHANYLCLLTTC